MLARSNPLSELKYFSNALMISFSVMLVGVGMGKELDTSTSQLDADGFELFKMLVVHIGTLVANVCTIK